MFRQIGQFALLLAALALGFPAWGHAASRPVPDGYSAGSWTAREIDVPHGDPLTTPLAFSPGERRLFADAEDGRLDEHSLVEAALLAGGVGDPGAVARYQRQFAALGEALSEELQRQNKSHGNNSHGAVEQVEAIHRLLHQRLLRRYDADATDLAAAFDTGVYNCASGTLLLIALAQDVGLNARAIELPGHVRATIDDGRRRWEVEITSLDWSEAVRPDLPESQRREVSPVGLVAMIYYNRAVDAFHGGRFAEAVAANRRALRLDPANREAHGNLLATVNNWALALCHAGRFDEAESLLTAGRQYAADHAPFTHNAAYVRRARIESQR